MSKTLNKVQLIGRLGADPETRYMQSGTPVTKFSLATNRQWQDKDGTLREETDWHNIVAWDKLAQTCQEYLTKGRLVYIEGRLQYSTWEYQGQTRYKTEIVASNMLILDSKPNGVAEPPPPQYEEEEAPAPRTRTAPKMAVIGGEPPSRSSRTAVIDQEDDPEDLPF